MLNDVIKFKVHIQKSLEDYESFVVEEVEEELGGDGIEGSQQQQQQDVAVDVHGVGERMRDLGILQ